MNDRRLAWAIYGVVCAAVAVWLSTSHLAASALAWVLYTGAAAIAAMLLSIRSRPQGE